MVTIGHNGAIFRGKKSVGRMTGPDLNDQYQGVYYIGDVKVGYLDHAYDSSMECAKEIARRWYQTSKKV